MHPGDAARRSGPAGGPESRLRVAGGWCGRGVGGAEEAADRVADAEVVGERRGLRRRAGVEADPDVVPLTAVGVIHPHADLGSGQVVGVRQHLVVQREVRRLGRGDRDHPERGRCAPVEVGPDLRPLHPDGAPGQATVDDDMPAKNVEAGVPVGQVHPLVVLGDAGRQVPRVDQPPHDVA